MSCIYETPNGDIVLMCKGADSVIEERLSAQSKNRSFDLEVFFDFIFSDLLEE